MARITSEDAVKQVGNRYDLILIGARRARELTHNYAPHIKSKNGNVVKAIKEIEQGYIGRDYLYRQQNIDKKRSKS